MAPQERLEIVQVLESSREEVNAAVQGILDSHASARLDPDRWTVLECLEHISAVEERLLGRLETAERLEEARVDTEKEAKLSAMVVNRSVRAPAPEMVVPTGKFSSVAEALDHFNASRSRTVAFAEEHGADLYLLATAHPRFGALNGNEMLFIMAGHARRHVEQIREIRAGIENS